MSSEEARKLRQAQQRLQKEQWQKKYRSATVSKRAPEIQSSTAMNTGGGGGGGGDGRQEGQPNVGKGAEIIGTDDLISDGKFNRCKPQHSK